MSASISLQFIYVYIDSTIYSYSSVFISVFVSLCIFPHISSTNVFIPVDQLVCTFPHAFLLLHANEGTIVQSKQQE